MIRAAVAALVAGVAAGAPGTPDPTWGGDGDVRTPLAKVDQRYLTLLPASSGRVVALGGGLFPGEGPASVVRYDADGKLDRAFANRGIFSGRRLVAVAGWQAGRILPSGRLLLAGIRYLPNIDTRVVFARLTPAGAFDQSFGKRGRLRRAFGAPGCDEIPVGMVAQAAKTVLALVTCRNTSAGALAAVARVLPDGTVDPAFGTRGRTFLQPLVNRTSGNSNPWFIGGQGDGKLLVGIAGDENDAAVVRLTSNGRLDRTFNRRGFVVLRHGYRHRLDPISGVFELVDGSFVAVACLDGRRTLLYRIRADGTGPRATNLGPSVHGCLQAVAPIGADLVGASDDQLVRVTTGGAIAWSAPVPEHAESVLVQPDGRVLTGAVAHFGPARTGFELRRFFG